MKSILVVDDDPDMLHLLQTVLTAYHFAVDTASNGREALEHIRAAVPDGIFLDLRMPVMDGFEVLDIMRREHPEVIVIVITASQTGDVAQHTRARGAHGCLMKPVDPQELRALLHAYFGWTPSGPRPSGPAGEGEQP